MVIWLQISQKSGFFIMANSLNCRAMLKIDLFRDSPVPGVCLFFPLPSHSVSVLLLPPRYHCFTRVTGH